jgi:hypothetical protein
MHTLDPLSEDEVNLTFPLAVQPLLTRKNMTRIQAIIYVGGGTCLIVLGTVVSGPSVPNFWLWMALPAIMIVRGTVRLLRA